MDSEYIRKFDTTKTNQNVIIFSFIVFSCLLSQTSETSSLNDNMQNQLHIHYTFFSTQKASEWPHFL